MFSKSKIKDYVQYDLNLVEKNRKNNRRNKEYMNIVTEWKNNRFFNFSFFLKFSTMKIYYLILRPGNIIKVF